MDRITCANVSRTANRCGAAALVRAAWPTAAGDKFRRQRPIGRYLVDFVCLERALIVEVDGSQDLERHGDYDTQRDDWLSSHGFRILRFTNADILTALPSVLEAIVAALESTPATMQRARPPSPRTQRLRAD